jgi:hypothetical protein
VKYAFRALRKHPKHFGLFVCFLASISKHFGIGNWYGEASIAEDWLLEKLDDQDGEDEDAKDDYAKTLHSYQAGEAWLAKQMLQRCALATGEEILELSDGLKWTARLRHIKEAIQIGARLMAKYNCKLWEFEYQHHSEYEEMHFSTCFGLMWEYEDHYTTEYEEYLQSLHSEGAGWVATLNYPIKADQQDITTQEFFQRVPTLEQFPRDLQTAMEHICGLLNYYLPKKKR